jgi:hypothetical protein
MKIVGDVRTGKMAVMESFPPIQVHIQLRDGDSRVGGVGILNKALTPSSRRDRCCAIRIVN